MIYRRSIPHILLGYIQRFSVFADPQWESSITHSGSKAKRSKKAKFAISIPSFLVICVNLR